MKGDNAAMGTRDFKQLEDEATSVFFRLLNKMLWGRKYPRDYGTGELLSMPEGEILEQIGDREKATVTLLADELGVSKAAVSTMTSRLASKGYLRKTSGKNNNKIKYLSLTAKGERARQGVKSYRTRLYAYLDALSEASLIIPGRIFDTRITVDLATTENPF